MVKKPWQKPTLVVLVKGKPEEAVLQACKFGFRRLASGLASTSSAPNVTNPGCFVWTDCSICNEVSLSYLD